MKRYIFLIVLFVAVPLAAYQAGPAGRANFGSNASQQPAQNGYRTFTNYNNRNWNQGVQTQPVQTSVAGSSVKELEALPKTAPAGKQAAPTKPSTGAASSAIKVNPVQCEGGKCKGDITFSKNSDPAAVMQQVQDMAQTMKALTGQASQGAPSAPAGQANAVPTMPAGMPDLSALMGGAMPTTPAPTSTPVKK